MTEGGHRVARVVMVVAFAVAAVAVGVAVTNVARTCSGPDLPPSGVDAGPGLAEIDEREREAERLRLERLRTIERWREEALREATEAEVAEYERAREAGPEGVLRWLRDFDARRFSDAGP